MPSSRSVAALRRRCARISVNGVLAGAGLSWRRSDMWSMLVGERRRPFRGRGDSSLSVVVRRANPADGKILLDLIRDLAEYEQLDPPDTEAQTRLLEDMFGPKPRIEAY